MKKTTAALIGLSVASLLGGAAAQADSGGDSAVISPSFDPALPPQFNVVPKASASKSDAPLFRRVHDCNVDFNPLLGYVGLSTLTTLTLKGKEHVANLVPAPPSAPGGRSGYYVLSDSNQATFVDVPVVPNESFHFGMERGPFALKVGATTGFYRYYQDDPINGRFEVTVNLACTANFDFKDGDGTPVRVIQEGNDGSSAPAGIPLTGTCSNFPPLVGVSEVPPAKKLGRDQIDRGVAGPRVDSAALEDLHMRLSTGMDRVIQKARAAHNPDDRKNACHLISAFFKSYNECGTNSLVGPGGLGEMSQKDPEFHSRLAALGELYASFREPSDSAECKPPVEGPAADKGTQSSRAEP